MIVVQMTQEYDYLFHAFYNVYHGICLYFINYVIHYYTFISYSSQCFYARTSYPPSLSLVLWWKIFHLKVEIQNCFLWTKNQSTVEQTHTNSYHTPSKKVYLLQYLTSPHTGLPFLQIKSEYEGWLRTIITFF